jgi:hypothetical protein
LSTSKFHTLAFFFIFFTSVACCSFCVPWLSYSRRRRPGNDVLLGLDRVQDLAVEGRTHFHLSPRSRDTYYVWKASWTPKHRSVATDAPAGPAASLPSDVPFHGRFVARQLHLPSDTREKQMHPPWYASASYGRRPHACILSIHEFSGGLPSLVTLPAPSSWITSRSLFDGPVSGTSCVSVSGGGGPICMCMHVAVLAS